MTFGNRIRTRRESLSLTRTQLGERLGVSASAVGNYEYNLSTPKHDVMLKLFDSLQIDPNYLYKGNFKNASSTMDHDEYQLVEKYRRLSEQGKTSVKTMVDVLLDTQTHMVHPSSATTRREIPLYATLKATGYTPPVYGTDFEYIAVQDLVPITAEYAVRIHDDSMEPLIERNGVVYVNRTPVAEGDIGIFCVNGTIYCKQYSKDSAGIVRLFSINRQHKTEDFVLNTTDGFIVKCFGRVIINNQPLPS